MRRTAGLLGYARMPVRVRKARVAKPKLHSLQYRVPGRVEGSSQLETPWHVFGVFPSVSPVSAPSYWYSASRPYPGGRMCAHAACCSLQWRQRRVYGTVPNRARSDACNSHIRQRCVLDPNQGFVDRSQETTVGLAQADLKSRFGCVICLIDNISPASSWSACGGYSPGLAAGQLAPLGE